MNQWMIHICGFLEKKLKQSISKSAYIDSKAEILGKVCVGENTNIGQSKIIAEDCCLINIAKHSAIRSQVLIRARHHIIQAKREITDIFIGSKVYISSEVMIEGPVIISDGTFIGGKSKIINSIVGTNCLIEDNVTLQNVYVPPNSVIYSKSFIDSKEKLDQVIQESKIESCCEFSCLGNK
ncbi:MAG: hypothetical protein HYY52_03820 [Candidatus Melainabacteria bacterium]|nr:hypothetical protein [Candidatus Melainabacteria bacterium]